MFGPSGGGFGGFGQQQQQQQQPAQQQGGGLFGGGGGFGGSTFGAQQTTPAFGQSQPAQPSGFGAFGGAAATSTPAFGASTSAPTFGAPATGGGLFGGAASTPAPSTGFSFGGGGTSAFGAPQTSAAPATGGLFGAPKPATTFGGFGQPAAPAPAAGGGLFGGGGGFGQPAAAQGTGTAVAPYQATTVMEPPKEEGKPDPPNQTPHSFQSICCMPQYANYSFEELRLQDYQANRKVPTAGSAPTFGGGFGASTSTPAFGQPAAPSGGLFGASSTPAFGSTTPAAGGFGAPAQPSGGLFGGGGATGAFGQSAQPASTGLFGATSQPAAGGGLFGAAKPATTFGQPAASAAPAFGGFGQPAASAAPAAGGFSFGQPAASAAPATGGLFGAASAAPASGGLFGQPAQQPATGGLFGQPATSQAAPAPSFSFGAAPAKPLFGAAPTSTPAFGAASTANAAPKPAFSFGAPATAPAAGGGLFGQPAQPAAAPAFGQSQPAAGGGLFGGGSSFGQPATSSAPTFGATGGLFGAKPAAPATGGLFGQSTTTPSLFGSQPQQQQPQQQQQQPSLFGQSLGSSFGGNLSTASQPQQATAYAVADDINAYGSNPLFQSASPSSRPAEEKKKPPIFTSFRGTPVNRSSTKITRLRGFGASTTSTNGSVGNNSPLSFGSSVGGSAGAPASPGGRGSPLRLVNGLGDEAAMSPNAFVSRSSVKKLVIDRKAMSESPFGKGRAASSPAPPTDKDASKTNGRSKVTFNPEAELPSRGSNNLFASSSSQRDGDEEPEVFNGAENTPVKRSGGSSANLGEDHTSNTPKDPLSSSSDWPRRPNNAPPPKHGEYYTIPSIDSLKKLPAHSLRAVKDLIVGRVGYGQVAFQDPVDLTTLQSVEDLLGGIVVFEDRNCTVYPDDMDSKPRSGQGLNVPATITLERCWPLDKATRQPIKEGPRLEKHVKRLRSLPETSFISYEEAEGSWVFAVENFD